MKSRPPALDLSLGGFNPATAQSSSTTISNPNSSAADTQLETEARSPPLPTPPLAKKKHDAEGNFGLEMERALGKVGNSAATSPELEKKQPLLELSIPIGLQ